jgi:hypothetical protein
MTDLKHYQIHVQNSKEGSLEHDYDLLQLGNRLSLSHSMGEQWSKSSKGQMVGTLEDDGNGVIIQLEGKKKPIELDYKEAAELQMLLLASLEKDYSTEFRSTQPVISYSGLSE